MFNINSIFALRLCLPLVVAVLFFPAAVSDAKTQAETATETSSDAEQLANEYQLAPGDKINVHVLGQGDLSVEVQVSDTNTIIYPLIGELDVTSLTRLQTEQLIHNSLKDGYLINPEVSVSIVGYRQIYIQGEVKTPGPYPYAPGLSLRRAILNAGGFTEVASKGKIYVVNEFDNDVDQKKIGLDYQLAPGDIITVKASFF